jgi:Cu(I)/Ag(I) efflux system membrane fusion protein
MKRIILYTVLLAAGVLLGWMLFGGISHAEIAHNQVAAKESNQMWTCSMHPQIMQSEPGNCPICGMELIPAQSSSDGLLANEFKLSKNAVALANIQTSIIGTGKVADKGITLSGKIEENEESNVVQVSYFSGRIEHLTINFTGEKVQKGQLLAYIYSPELYTAQQELLTAASLKKDQPLLYKAVRNKLKLWKLSESQINEIEATAEVLKNFPVYATVSGTISEKLVAEGDYVKQGQTILKMANLETVWANFDVYENQINAFKKGQEIRITTNVYPQKEFKAKVAFIDPILNTKTRTVKLRVVLDNKNNVFKPGMFVEGQITGISRDDKQRLMAPASAILWTGKRSVVYVKTNPEAPVFEMHEIILGTKIGEGYEILEGLNMGDEIVTNGTFTVDAAAQLRGKKSMMNKEKTQVFSGDKGQLDLEKTTSLDKENTSSRTKRLVVSKDFQQQLKTVFNDYIILKDALVKDDSEKTQKVSKILLEHLSTVDMKLLIDKEAHNQWMIIEKGIKRAAGNILITVNIKEQRMHFKKLSFELTNAIEVFSINEKVYRQFCPMADSNEGAYWLSKEEKVMNPYYGKAMLACGEVKQIIK